MTRLLLTAAALLAVGSAVVAFSHHNRRDHGIVGEGDEIQRVAETEAPADGRTSEHGPEPITLKADRAIYRLASAPDGKTFAVVEVGFDKHEKKTRWTLAFRDAEKGEVRRSADVDSATQLESIAFAPDGKTLAVAATRRAGQVVYSVKLIDPETGATRKTIPLRGTVRAVAYSPDGKLLAIGGQEFPKGQGPLVRTVQLWDIAEEKTTREFRQELRIDDMLKSGQLDGLRDLRFSPDGQFLAAADVDFRVRLIDARTGGVTRTLQGHTDVVLGLAFSPDGEALATAGFDRTVRIWDVRTGTERRTLQGNKGQVWRIAFSPDGNALATGGMFVADGLRSSEVILWDARSWRPMRVLPDVKGGLETPAFSPDSKVLAVGVGTEEGTGAIRLWRLADLRRNR